MKKLGDVMDTDFANITGMFKTNTDLMNKAITEVSPDRWFAKPGDESNHLMWVLGHVLWSRSNILKLLNEPCEIPSASLFSRGAQLAEEKDYPSVEEMREAWHEVSTKLSAALANASGETLSRAALPGPPSFNGKLSGTVAFLAFHETYHVGQVSYLKKWLGYGQTVG